MPERAFPPELLDRYLGGGIGRVPGWFQHSDAVVLKELGQLQTEAGVRGSVGEIGVYYGKSFIVLCLLLHDGERAFAVDVFDADDLNVDESGDGASEEGFRNNIRAHVGADVPLELVKDSSLNVTGAQLVDRVGPARIFSVDGGHTAEITYNDISIAADTLANEGFIMVDDYFNPAWPAVSDGVQAFVRDHEHAVRPFAIGRSKVFFARREAADRYREGLRQKAPALHFKTTEFMGTSVDVYKSQTTKERLTGTPAWRSFRKTALGASLRRGLRTQPLLRQAAALRNRRR